jgi:uncharacterized protein GlcG (DUF336 family)
MSMTERHLMNLKTNLPLDAACTIIDTALATGRETGLLPLTVAVLDAGGNLIALKREDGSGILRTEIAFGKAWASLGMGIPSRIIGARLHERPAFQGALAAASGGRFVSVPGGVLVCDPSGEVVGAVGISGDTSDRDEYCAIVGIKAAGYTPSPEEPAPNWNASRL